MNDKKIRQTLIEEGLIFPETESEIVYALQSMDNSDIEYPTNDLLSKIFLIIDRRRDIARKRMKTTENTDYQHEKGLEIAVLNELKSELTIRFKKCK